MITGVNRFAVPYPQGETAGHPPKNGTTCGTESRNASLKSLAVEVLRRARVGHQAGREAGQDVPQSLPPDRPKRDIPGSVSRHPLSQAMPQASGTGLSEEAERLSGFVPLFHGADLGQAGHLNSPEDFYRQSCSGYWQRCLAGCPDANLGSTAFCRRFRWEPGQGGGI